MSEKEQVVSESKLGLWDSVSHPPKYALKEIEGGRMKGMTDINPQWRLKKLTELFGPCGMGWSADETRREFMPCGNEIAVFVDVALTIEGFNKPITGTGGSMFRVEERNGLRCNDDAVKMATTDAISVCCKKLGIGSSIYEGAWDGSKYLDAQPEAPQKPATATKPADPAPAMDKAKEAVQKVFEAPVEREDADVQEDTGVLDSVEAFPGVNKKTGKDYIRYGVQIDGVKFGSFDTKLGEAAEALQGEKVVFTWRSRGKYKDILAIEPLATAGNAPEDQPFEGQF